MKTGPVIGGSGRFGVMMWGPAPGMLKAIRSEPGAAFASWIAWLSDPGPLELVLVTTSAPPPGAVTAAQGENSDVLPLWSLVVAVITWPGDVGTPIVTLNGAEPPTPRPRPLSVARNCCPSPLPDASHAALT